MIEKIAEYGVAGLSVILTIKILDTVIKPLITKFSKNGNGLTNEDKMALALKENNSSIVEVLSKSNEKIAEALEKTNDRTVAILEKNGEILQKIYNDNQVDHEIIKTKLGHYK